MVDSVESHAAELAREFEGFASRPYLDTIAKPPRWTYGYGSIWTLAGDPVTADTPPISEPDARTLLAVEMHATALMCAAACKVVLSTHQRAAIVDLAYNIGIGNFRSSTLLRRLNDRDWHGAAEQFGQWDHAGGRVIAGLLRRRKAEESLFEQPDEPAPLVEAARAPAPAPAQAAASPAPGSVAELLG